MKEQTKKAARPPRGAERAAKDGRAAGRARRAPASPGRAAGTDAGAARRGIPRHRLVETAMGWAWFAAADGAVVKSELPVPTRGEAEEAVARWDGRSREDVRLLPEVAAALADYFAGRSRRLDAPLALDACGDFLRRVYEELRRVPHGEILSYGELARRIGQPGAARSVGTALARNPFPPMVPCHRVVAADRSLGGFSASGGLWMKQRLLALEGHRLRARLERAGAAGEAVLEDAP